MAAERQYIRALFGALAVILLLTAQVGAAEQDATIEDFFGTYVGNARIEADSQFRDIIVAIEPARKGFSIYTSTVIREGPVRAVAGVKWRSETQQFVESDVPHLYEPLLRESMFAKRRTPNLVDGDTVAWASIRGRTLGVYAMNVLEDGHYELRVYERTLTELGMDLSFIRYRDGVAVRGLTGILARTKED
jgi:hypothetical protein